MDPNRNSYKCWAFLLFLLVVESAVVNGRADASNSGLPVAFDTVPLGDFHIRTYEKELGSLNRFYFAPLALLEHTSASSGRNNLTGENQLAFRVEMWTEELVHVVKEHLSNVTGLDVAENKVSVLPFEKVSMRCRRCGSSGTGRPDSHWRSFSHGPKQMQFRLVCPTLEECRDLGQQMITHPEQFSSQLTLYFRFDHKSLTSGGSLRRKSASVSGEHVWNGPIMADLNRRFSNSSFALVTAQDRARIVSEALENVLTDVEVLEDSDNLGLEPEDETRLRRILENLIFENHIIPLEEDDESSWNSLYWDYENAGSDVRPDVMARKLNKIYQNADEKERKWMVQQVMQDEPSGLMASAKNVVSDETLRALTNVFQTSPSRLSSRLEESRRTIQWERNHFAPRLTKLYRINLDKLRNSFKPVRNIPIKYSVVDLKLDLNVQPTMSRINFDRKPQIPKSTGNEEIQEQSQPAPTSDPTGNEADPGIFQGKLRILAASCRFLLLTRLLWG
ncbi:uncharacterized protein LOC124205379 isoform X1 [Daphnia pulex]|uniref:uncharacterized protein LOC124205379 isoform X1 n=1 Tax=Daphnia pulex TaxID=6669 RepID=UPI001EDFA268|nr:uncharacterized protein LOC124205379 isoform X1 [Daphnia pulex]XP_046458762.1 uncharacterized protein LOC124205379 isoform X1 [Daphnia pulex]